MKAIKLGKFAALCLVSVTLLLQVACDPERKKKCEWFLMPDQDRIGKVDEGFVPLCARNFENNKQDCRLQAKMDFARNAYNKKFRYVDLEVDGVGIPRTVTKISYCD